MGSRLGTKQRPNFIHGYLGTGRITIAWYVDKIQEEDAASPQRLTFAAALCSPESNFNRKAGRGRASQRVRHPHCAKGAETFGASIILATPLGTSGVISDDVVAWFNHWMKGGAPISAWPAWCWREGASWQGYAGEVTKHPRIYVVLKTIGAGVGAALPATVPAVRK